MKGCAHHCQIYSTFHIPFLIGYVVALWVAFRKEMDLVGRLWKSCNFFFNVACDFYHSQIAQNPSLESQEKSLCCHRRVRSGKRLHASYPELRKINCEGKLLDHPCSRIRCGRCVNGRYLLLRLRTSRMFLVIPRNILSVPLPLKARPCVLYLTCFIQPSSNVPNVGDSLVTTTMHSYISSAFPVTIHAEVF